MTCKGCSGKGNVKCPQCDGKGRKHGFVSNTSVTTAKARALWYAELAKGRGPSNDDAVSGWAFRRFDSYSVQGAPEAAKQLADLVNAFARIQLES